ncbi:MAG: hypothetical protein LUC26_04040 [Prevotella sp.]|nr:hypothetical protein [Prevotella sp.]
MERYIKPETDVVCTDALNDIAGLLSGDETTNDEVGDPGECAKGFNDWDEADDFGW